MHQSRRFLPSVVAIAIIFCLLPGVTRSSPGVNEVLINDVDIGTPSGSYPLVSAHVSVLDEQGAHISGLAATDFVVQERGAAMQLDVAEERVGVIVLILIDTSGTMDYQGTPGNDRFADAQRAASELVRSLSPDADWSALYTFNRDVTLVKDLAWDHGSVDNAIWNTIQVPQSGEARMWTALWNGVFQAVDYLASPPVDDPQITARFPHMRKAIVVFSDGKNDLKGGHTPDDILAELKSRDPNGTISIYTVGVGSETVYGRGQEAANFADLQRLADLTEGDFFHLFGTNQEEATAQNQQLGGVLAKFASRSSQYRLTYSSRAPDGPAELTVSVGTVSARQEISVPPVPCMIDLSNSLPVGTQMLGNFLLEPNFPVRQREIERVDYYLEGSRVGTSQKEQAFTFRFNAGQFPVGTYSITAIAYDAGGYECRTTVQDVQILPTPIPTPTSTPTPLPTPTPTPTPRPEVVIQRTWEGVWQNCLLPLGVVVAIILIIIGLFTPLGQRGIRGARRVTGRVVKRITTRLGLVPRPQDQMIGEDIPHLIAQRGPHTGERFELRDRNIPIGADPGACTVRLDRDEFISGVHARIRVEDGRYYLFHESQTNPTLLNKHEVMPGKRVSLSNGDVIEMGSTGLLFVNPGQTARETPSPETPTEDERDTRRLPRREAEAGPPRDVDSDRKPIPPGH